MKLHTLAAACAALLSLSATAAFASDPVTAKLAQPLAQPVKFIAGGAIFVCEADACVARAATSNTYSVDTCKTVAAKVGPIAAFSDTRTFTAERLTACNASAVAKAKAGEVAQK
ncbi:MAG TPA: hypothetical protein VLI41_11270 [Phenylobacterium sp.]|uniref:CC_3452 family protein n=1 Tax=Phenylobacterium sp. TaxID=1871053 RepID=UPI002BF70082|nr:hypothetical protein [Phenylobacterium sp.]HSV03772.1 hypothetical protein [Phenylobacterium sp.]